MKKLYILLFVAFAGVSFGQVTIAEWNFDASNATPTTGSGTISLIGGTTAPASPNNFPAGNPSTGKSISSENYPAQGTLSGTAGFKITSSTLGFSGITISFEQRGSNTASRWSQYEYTTDGTNWTVLGNNSGAVINGWPSSLVTLNLPAGANDNSNFSFRIVSIFSPVAFVENSVIIAANTAYEKINTTATSTYGTTGTWRLDNVTIKGTSLSSSSFNAIENLKIFVNNNNLFVTSNSTDDKQVNVYNMQGKEVVNSVSTGSGINVSDLSSGIYIVKVTENGVSETRKIAIK